MPALQVKDCPADVYERLRICAAVENRSISQQTLSIIKEYLDVRESTQVQRGERQSKARPSYSPVPDDTDYISKRKRTFERIRLDHSTCDMFYFVLARPCAVALSCRKMALVRMKGTMVDKAQTKALTATESRSRSVAFTALTIAIMAVSAWITVPIGPVPFTLQMFAVTFAILVLAPKQAIGAIAGYLALGAIGVPVFSGMRGGIGVLMGPTGGFLWGYLIGVSVAVGVLALFRRRGVDTFAVGVVCGLVFTAIAYACGWLQYQCVAGVGPFESFFVTVAPFVIVDIVKVVAATAAARAVIRAVSIR